jgi:20S proteasome alpha/beta subunit
MEYLNYLKKPGFDFSNQNRNSKMISKQVNNSYKKTGTTIVGVLCPSGVVLAADTRATAGFIAEKNCSKIHYVAPNIRSCGAGTAADLQYVMCRDFLVFF